MKIEQKVRRKMAAPAEAIHFQYLKSLVVLGFVLIIHTVEEVKSLILDVSMAFKKRGTRLMAVLLLSSFPVSLCPRKLLFPSKFLVLNSPVLFVSGMTALCCHSISGK